MTSILITGGAGFAGSNLALSFKRKHPAAKIIAFDNLKRRGSELALPRLKQAGIEFVHGDVRVREDLLEVGPIDLLVDCAAEPSVMAGTDGSPGYVIQTNLVGSINCLEAARLSKAALMFLSTSRVYPIAPINSLAYVEEETRFAFSDKQSVPGASRAGISEDFPLTGARSLYGSSKLCSELLIEEYIDTYNMQAVINRCGVLTGPWQMGKVDQGVIVLWVAKHIFQKELAYIGYGGTGKQVRDILHIDDLFELLSLQLDGIAQYSGGTYNVGGGLDVSLSLRELTELCQEVTGNQIPIKRVAETRANDLPLYISDCAKIHALSGWRPKTGAKEIISGIAQWIQAHKVALEPILA